MRVATWNVNGLRARVEFVLHWLRERQPDLVGLQELKLTDEQFPHDAFAAAGYRAVTHGQKAWNGVAVLSRSRGKPLEVTQRGLPGQEARGARLITAQLDDLAFTSVYVPNGKFVGHEDFPAKLDWLDALLAHVEAERRPETPAILCGDFNICPAAIDSYDEAGLRGEIFHTDEERARFRRLLEWGLVDVFRAKQPDVQAFSWWDYRGGAFHRGHGLRIDFLLATQSVLARVRSVEIDREYRKKKDGLTASDHAPVFADLD
ncbi:MAG: exodeoxyribonuclease III [Deltaproteobacteria bacterium]|nr:MAG: exodeoxyribonuclease III [Deltaproteobacteria bacterium]